MRRAEVFVDHRHVGTLEEIETGRQYRFIYDDDYAGEPVSLTMPVGQKTYVFDAFPPFFDGLLPEGVMLDALLKGAKIDRNDLFGQLVQVGEELIGNVSVREQK